MNTILRKILTCMLCLALFCTMLPVSALTAAAEEADVILPDDGNDEEDGLDVYAEAVDVSNGGELARALSQEAKAIRIVADFQLDQTFYVISDVVIFTEESHTLTRAPGFGGDIFVVGLYEDGTACEEKVTLSVGHEESETPDLLIIDGNRDNMSAQVVGAVFFGCSNTHIRLYSNLTVRNCKKVGNERTLDEAYGLPYPERIGGAVAILAEGSMNVYGGTYTNNGANDEGTEEETALLSTQGGAFYLCGATRIYGGTFTNNHAYRGGAFYAYRTLSIYGGTVQDNTASDRGGAVYMPANPLCYLYVAGDEDENSVVMFKNNQASLYGGALYCQGSLVNVQTALFEGNTAGNSGGAVYCIIEGSKETDARFTATNTIFRNNSVDYTGGAVYIKSSHGYFENVIFEGNHTAALANANGDNYGGGALYATGSYVEINGAEIKDNTSDYHGAALEAHSSSELVLNKIKASGNQAGKSGGFLYANKSATKLYNSAIRTSSAGAAGGAAFLTNAATLHAYVTTFENNTAVSHGGALYVYTGAVTSLLHSCVFLENHSDAYGGAMYVSSASILQAYNLSAKGNSATRGGFMYETTTNTTVTLNGLVVSGNTASDGGPIIWGNTTKAILYINKTNYIDVDSTAALDDAYWAAAIANNLTVTEITDEIPGFVNYGETEETPPESLVNPNVTNAIELQAALAAGLREITIISDFVLDRTFFVVDDVSIRVSGNRTLTRSASFGGDLFVVGQNVDGTLCETDVTMTMESLEDSTLTIDGNSVNMSADVVGTVFFVCKTGHVELHSGITITGCEKVGNERALDEIHGLTHTDEIGGAVAIVAGGTMDIYGGTFTGNRVNNVEDGTSSRGGVLYAFGNVNIYGGTFTGNQAYRGGVLYVYRTVNIHNAVIRENAAHMGGAIYVPDSTVAYLYLGASSSIADSDVRFIDNTAASEGGAIYTLGKLVQIENTQFVSNSADSHGGAVNARKNEKTDDRRVIIKDTKFRENTSNANGGALYLNKADVQMSNVDFVLNHSYAANYGGGAMYSTGADSKLEGVRFTQNTSTANGGAVALYGSSQAVFYNVTADGNSAEAYGGFAYNNSTLDVYNTTLKNNTSNKNGGALYLTNPAVTNVYDTSFENNTAVGNGGALCAYTNGTKTLVQNSRFVENHADGFGGAIMVYNLSVLDLYDITATRNSAGSGGFMYETTKGTIVTINGLTVSGNTDTEGGPIIWGNTYNAKLYINKANYTDTQADTLDDAYWTAAIYNKLTVEDISTAVPGYDEYGNENYENLAGYVSVSNADELEKALSDKAEKIRIVADFTLDRTFYVTHDVTIFSATPYRLTRAADFAGDLFVVGEAPDGSSCLVNGSTPTLTLGNPDSQTKDLLVIDGNRYATTVQVVGTALFICNSARATLHHNVSIVNAKKTGNQRTLDEKYTVSYPSRIGGAAVILESGTLNINGAALRGNAVNEEVISDTLGEDGRLCTLGGAIFSMGDINVYSGSFEHNKAARGGFIYNYRMTHVYGGSFRNNYASVSGGVFYLPGSEYATTYMGGTTGETTVVFENNAAAKSGGAIYSSAVASTIVYGDTAFKYNRAETANGGAIYASGTLLVENVTFTENEAYSKGGAVYLSNTSNDRVVRLNRFNGCSFTGNIANKGGAVCNYASSSNFDEGAKATFNDCRFLDNEAVDRVSSNSTSVGYGGALYALYRSTVNVNNGTFRNNCAAIEGGALYMGYESKVTITASTFAENSVGSENTGYGGAISLHSSFLNVDDTDFTQNAATLRGGALYISYNSARKTDSQVKITNSLFTENTSGAMGGAIYSTDRLISPGVDAEGNELPKEDNNTLNVVMLNTQFVGNTANEKGGAMYLTNYSHAYMNNVAFKQNKALGEASGHNAGAIYCSGSSTFEINGGEFTENTAGANGGAIGMYSSASAVMNNVTATGNTATTSAGFMMCDTAYATIYNSTIENNVAGYTAGAISTVDLATIHVYGTDFIGNTATGAGGALYVYAGAVTSVLHGCTFRDNQSGTNGGAIYASKASLLEAYNITAQNNRAACGGFLYETTSKTQVTLNGLTVTDNTATTGGPIIWGNTTKATLYINKANYTDTTTDNLDDAYWAAAIVNLLTVEEIDDTIPAAPTYTDSYKPEAEKPVKQHNEVDVEHIFYLAENGKDSAINATYGSLLKLDNSSNFMSKNTTTFQNVNGQDVKVDAYVYHKNDVADNCNVGEGLLIYQAMCYKRAHPEEDVKISLSSFRLSVSAAICVDRDSRYFGYMRPLYGANYDAYGFVRISYLLVCAASMGIDVTVIGQLDGNPRSSSDPGFEAYFTDMLDAPCDSDYVSDAVVGDYMTFSAMQWTSYDNKAATDMMHTKMCAVSHYLDKDGNAHRNAVWLSSSNLDGVASTGVNGVNKLQTAVLISDHAEIYRVSRNYLDLLAPYSGQEDAYAFRDIAIQRSTQQIDLIRAGRGNEIAAEQQIVYLGSENDAVFELYFAPFGGELSNWDENYNPFAKQLRALQNSEDSIILIWNNVKFVEYSLRNQMQQIIIDAFHKNAHPDNKIYVNLPDFNQAAFKDLTVGKDIGYKSFNKFEYGDIHNKDMQLSYVQNGQRYYVSLLNSMNVHSGSMAYQSNFALVIKETNCNEDSVFFTIADDTTSGIVSHAYSDEVLEYIPDGMEDGYSYHPCTNCDKKQIIDLIHRSGEWTVVKDATPEENGVAHKSCQVCGLLLESREYEFAGEDMLLDMYQSGGKTFTKTKTAEAAVQLDSIPSTIEATIQLSKSMDARGGVIIGNYDGSTKNQINLEVYNYGKLRLYTVAGGRCTNDYHFATDIRSDEPVHMALTIEERTVKLYLDGELKETVELANELPAVSGTFRIGGDNRSGNGQYFKGTLYNVSLFSDVRSLSEMQEDAIAVFAQEEGLLVSKYFNEATKAPMVTAPVGRSFTAADAVDVPTLSATPLTIEATIHVPKSQSDRAGTIIGNYDGATARRLNLEFHSDGKIRLYVHNGTTSVKYLFSKDVRSDAPVHIAVTFNDKIATLYVNGEAASTQKMSFALPEVTEGFRVGGDQRSGNEQYFKGVVYDVNMFDHVRTADEIKQDMLFVPRDAEGLLHSKSFTTEGPITNSGNGYTFTKGTIRKIGDIASTPFTMEAVVQLDERVSKRGGVIVGNYDGLSHKLMNLEIYERGRVRLYYAAKNGTVADCIFDTDIRSKEAVHIAVTIDGLTATVYVDGAQADQKTLPFAVPEDIVNDFRIGGDKRSGNGQYFKGTIYSVHLFSDVRTPEEIAADAAGVEVDIQDLLYAEGATPAEAKKPMDNMVADGRKFAPKATVFTGNLTSAPLTLEALIQLDKSISERAGVIVGNYDTAKASNLMSLEIYSEGRVRLYYVTETGKRVDCTFDTDIRSDEALHLAVTVDGLTATLYINGMQTEQKQLPFAVSPLTTEDFRIGGDRREGNELYFKGTIYSAHLFSEARTAEQIKNDLVVVRATDPSLLYSNTFAVEDCSQVGHVAGDWVQDVSMSETHSAISHKQCIKCGKWLECKKQPKVSTVVQHLVFDGADGFKPNAQNVYALDDAFASAPRTFEAVVQLDTSYTQRAGVIIGNYDGGTGNQFNLEVYTSGKLRLYYIANRTAYNYNFKTDIRSDSPTHITLTVDGRTAKLYLDGQCKETVTLPAAIPEIVSGYKIGGDNRVGNTQYFKGTIYTACLFSDVRTSEEIAVDRYLPQSDSDNLLVFKNFLNNK